MNLNNEKAAAGKAAAHDHFGRGDHEVIYTEHASKARVTKPIPVILVMTKATPKGSVVTVPGRLGSERFGDVGQLLVEYVKLHFARQAAGMGHQIAFITQSDGKEADWSLRHECLEAWEASFGQGGD